MMSSIECSTRVIVRLALLGFTLGVSLASGEPVKEKGPDSLPLSIDTVTGATARPVRTQVEWDGREYDVESGIDVLMSAIRDPEKSAEEHELALLGLAMLGRQLQSHPCLDELATLYDRGKCLEKSIILTCFLGSRDPRGIPVFFRTLDNEEYMKLRLSAASGLAGWNVRRGVAQLLDLLDSREVIRSRMPYVRDNAMRTFRLQNIRKGWGFPDDKESAEWPPDVMPPPDVAARLKPRPTVEEIKKWFAENEHRFPDWKLGDPLPTNGEGDKDDSSKP